MKNVHIVSSKHQLHKLITRQSNNFQVHALNPLDSQSNGLKFIIGVEKDNKNTPNKLQSRQEGVNRSTSSLDDSRPVNSKVDHSMKTLKNFGGSKM
jgi:hypothetical protein